MGDRTIVVYGLPDSGKTTFLAALWHLVTARDLPLTLSFHSLRDGDSGHLNSIAARWRGARVQDRTPVASHRAVTMNLLKAPDAPLRITFPDVSGEAFRRMWEDRDCDPRVAEDLKSGDILLFIHSDTIRPPQWVVDLVALSRALGLPLPAGHEVPWHPRLAPTQVQVVGLLQLLRQPPLDVGPRRLAVMLSAWDKAVGEGLDPAHFLKVKLPLLDQYLRSGVDGWQWRVYGVSAQGGEYDPVDPAAPRGQDADALRAVAKPSMRIRLVQDGNESHDLTEPLAWLIS